MKGGDYRNQVFKQLQDVMKKCDDLSHKVKTIEKKLVLLALNLIKSLSVCS